MVEWVYNDFENNYCNSDYLIKGAILCTTYKTDSMIDSINKQILTKMPEYKTILHSKNTPVDEEQAALYPVEFLNGFEVSGIPPANIFKLSGPQKGQTIFIPRMSLYPDEEESPFTFKNKRRQFPIKLAFSVTINKYKNEVYILTRRCLTMVI